jgi:hypothetical protein
MNLLLLRYFCGVIFCSLVLFFWFSSYYNYTHYHYYLYHYCYCYYFHYYCYYCYCYCYCYHCSLHVHRFLQQRCHSRVIHLVYIIHTSTDRRR